MGDPIAKQNSYILLEEFIYLFMPVYYKGRRPQLTKEEIERLADGRIFTADQALGAKLVERVRYLDNAVEAMKASLGLKDARVITYHRSGAYKGTIYSGAPEASHTEINLIAINTGNLDPLTGIRFMYL
jgi:protease-4